MATSADITPELCRRFLRYDPETGSLFWREKPGTTGKWHDHLAGKQAFATIDDKGYRHGRLLGVRIKTHRAIWAIQTGHWPENQIDHINGNPADNRWENLREVTHASNQRNKGRNRNNKSGYPGVYWLPNKRRWRAKITVNYRSIHIGLYSTLEEAVAARLRVAELHGFTPDHGHRVQVVPPRKRRE